MIHRYLTLTLIIIMLSACGTGLSEIQVPGPPLAGLPSLNSLKSGSDITGDDQAGSLYYMASDGAEVIDGELSLPAAPDGLEWGIWRFNPGDLDVSAITINLSATSSGEYFAGLSDFSLARWEISGPYSETQLIELDPLRHQSSEGNFYIAILCHDGNEVGVEGLVLQMESGWTLVQIPGATGYIVETSMASVGGRPAIAFLDENLHVMMARSATASGSAATDWSIVDVSQGNTENGFYISLAEIQGRPAIAYPQSDGEFELDNDQLIFASSTTVDGLQPGDWNKVPVITDGGNIGHGPDLAIIGGNPAISCAGPQGRLHYCYATTPGGTQPGDWQAVELDPDNLIALNTALLEVDGRPAIAYQDSTGTPGAQGHLKYAISATASGSTEEVWSYLLLAPSGNGNFINKDLEMQMWQGRPAICFRRELNALLEPPQGDDYWFASATTTDGSSLDDWSLNQLDVPGERGFNGSLTVFEGEACVSYYSIRTGALRLACSPPGGPGSVSWRRSTIDGEGSTGDSSSISVIDGRLAISYVDYTDDQLTYAVLLD
jgi:hypothetical protein